eukprot:6182900-Pleurochrysis_carterae.AAC.1
MAKIYAEADGDHMLVRASGEGGAVRLVRKGCKGKPFQGDPCASLSNTGVHLRCTPTFPRASHPRRALLPARGSCARWACCAQELRSVPLRLSARVRVGAGDAVFMSHVSRGSSVGAVAACTRFEHRGRTPARGWQIELLLTCVLVDADGLSQRLRALGQQFAREREPHAASLASAPTDATSGERAVLDANAQHFVDHPGYAKKAKHVTNALNLQGGPHSWHGSARRAL